MKYLSLVDLFTEIAVPLSIDQTDLARTSRIANKRLIYIDYK
jgi:hypothetical protein